MLKYKGDLVVDLGFKLRIGVDLELLMEQQIFYEDQPRIRFVAFGAFTDMTSSHRQVLDPRIIHNSIDMLHSFDGPVTFQRRKQRHIGEGKAGFHFLEAHRKS